MKSREILTKTPRLLVIGHFRVALCLIFKTKNHLNENEFDLHENGCAGETHFHMNGFKRTLVLTQWQNVTRKWPINFHEFSKLLIKMLIF